MPMIPQIASVLLDTHFFFTFTLSLGSRLYYSMKYVERKKVICEFICEYFYQMNICVTVNKGEFIIGRCLGFFLGYNMFKRSLRK